MNFSCQLFGGCGHPEQIVFPHQQIILPICSFPKQEVDFPQHLFIAAGQIAGRGVFRCPFGQLSQPAKGRVPLQKFRGMGKDFCMREKAIQLFPVLIEQLPAPGTGVTCRLGQNVFPAVQTVSKRRSCLCPQRFQQPLNRGGIKQGPV